MNHKLIVKFVFGAIITFAVAVMLASPWLMDEKELKWDEATVAHKR